MDISYLSEFLDLTETLNYGETSYRCNVTQSSLTRHIQSMERDLGHELFDRTTRSIHLTEYGLTFLPYAQKIVSGYKEGIEAVKSLANKSDRIITFGSIARQELFDIIDHLISFRNAYPDYEVNIVVAHMDELERMFDRGELNIYSAVRRDGPEDFVYFHMDTTKIKAAVRYDSSFAERQYLTISEIGNSPILLPEEPLLNTKVRNVFKARGINPNVIYSGDFLSAIGFVRAGMGISLHPDRSSAAFHDPELKIIDVIPDISTDFGLAYRKELTHGEKLLVDHAIGMHI